MCTILEEHINEIEFDFSILAILNFLGISENLYTVITKVDDYQQAFRRNTDSTWPVKFTGTRSLKEIYGQYCKLKLIHLLIFTKNHFVLVLMIKKAYLCSKFFDENTRRWKYLHSIIARIGNDKVSFFINSNSIGSHKHTIFWPLFSKELCCIEVRFYNKQSMIVEVGDNCFIISRKANSSWRIKMLPMSSCKINLIIYKSFFYNDIQSCDKWHIGSGQP